MKKYQMAAIGLAGICVGVAGIVATGDSDKTKIETIVSNNKSDFELKYEQLMVQRETKSFTTVNENEEGDLAKNRVVFKDKYGNFRLCGGECGACGLCL